MNNQKIIFQNQNTEPLYDIDRSIYVNFEYPPHFHSNPEFIYIIEGEVDIIIDGETMKASARQFCIVLPWQIHAFHTPVYSRMLIIVTAERFTASFMNALSGYHSQSQVFLPEEEISSLFVRFISAGALPHEYMLTCILYGLCDGFLQKCPLIPNEDREKDHDIRQVMIYISNHLSSRLTLKEVADALGYNYYYLSRTFKSYAGMNFNEFCNAQRIEYAYNAIIVKGVRNITRLAYDSGFTSIRSFNRNFRHLLGLSPTQLIEQLQNQGLFTATTKVAPFRDEADYRKPPRV